LQHQLNLEVQRFRSLDRISPAHPTPSFALALTPAATALSRHTLTLDDIPRATECADCVNARANCGTNRTLTLVTVVRAARGPSIKTQRGSEMQHPIRNRVAMSRLPIGLLAMICVLTFAACGKKDEAAPVAAATSPAAGASPQVLAPAAPEVTVATLLASATRAVSEDRLVAPSGDNAIEFYLQALAKEANNVSATQALVDLFPLAAGNAEREIVNRNLDEATRIIGLLDQASPGSYTVSTLKSKLNAARTQMTREDERRLAQEAAAQQQREAAAQQAAAPAATPVATTPPRSATEAGSTPATSAPPAATAAAQPPPVVAKPAGENRDPVLVRQVRPTYPAAAARRRQEGWVEVTFTVGTDGSVTDVNVARSQPRGVFDRDAVRAVSQWKFEAALSDGKPAVSSLTRRIEFSLKGQ